MHRQSPLAKEFEVLEVPLNHTHGNYFVDNMYESPVGSDDESDEEDNEDTESDSTCEDDERFSFGAPLERMPRQHIAKSGFNLVYDTQKQVAALLKASPCSSGLPSRNASFISDSSNLSYDSMCVPQNLICAPRLTYCLVQRL